MNFLLKRPASFLVCLGLLFTSTGCMVSPGDGDNIGNYQARFPVIGFTVKPYAFVRIEARHPETGWEQIGWAQASSSPVAYDGIDWYAWNTSVKIPKEFWSFVEEHDWHFLLSAEIRAVDSLNGNALAAFEAGYFEWFDFHQSLTNMWNEHGNGRSATVFGWCPQ